MARPPSLAWKRPKGIAMLKGQGTSDSPTVPGDPRALVRLMTWLSPGFPVGAFAYSHGLECAIADARVTGGETVFGWVRTLLLHGSGWNDLVLFAEAHRAASAGDLERLAETIGLGRALGGSKERREETMALGVAFAAAAAPWAEDGAEPGDAPYPVAVARVAAAQGVALEEGLAAFAQSFAASLVAAATRLVPLGQGTTVAVLRRLEPIVLAAAARAARSTLDDLGSAAILSDISAMRHETLPTRLFRS